MSHVSTLLASSAVALTGVTVLSIVPPALAHGGDRQLHADLTGAAEVPGPGDPDGDGKAKLKIDPSSEEICYRLRVDDIAPATAAHIHKAPVGVAGPVVVPLVPAPSDGRSRNCVRVERALAQAILDDPAAYYVNVHNATFQAGAVRGQLR